MNGVVIETGSTPGGTCQRQPWKYGEGGTLGYEVGHWVTLEHTCVDAADPCILGTGLWPTIQGRRSLSCAAVRGAGWTVNRSSVDSRGEV
jgi:hypothetical protein